MDRNGRKVLIIGGGIAGLCTAAYALKCGYEVQVLEMNDVAGGLAMSWKRGPYIFETCLHWLVGSGQHGELRTQWEEVFDVNKLTFVDAEEFVRIETEHGDILSVYTDVDRLEAELLRRAPQDALPIKDLTHSIRMLGKFKVLDPSGGLAENWLNMLRDLPVFPLLRRLSRMSGAEYGRRFSDSLLRNFFSSGDIGKMSAIAMVISLAWMNERNAGYCIGGSQAIIRLIAERIAALGGEVRLNAKVTRVVVENDVAVGVELASGEVVRADWVVSAADGHATIFEMLSGKYVDEPMRKRYDEKELFASYLQVSLGVGMDLRNEPHMLSLLLDVPVRVDPKTAVEYLGFRFFHYDPTFAPPGKTAVTSLLSTRNYEYWVDLRKNDPEAYRTEKRRIGGMVAGALEKRIPGLLDAIEVVDVSTPASVIRYTGNWKGTMEGWLAEPGGGFRPLPNTLPGLKQFVMAGQWVMPGGGLPSGLMTARVAVKQMCRHDRVPFDLHTADVERPQLVGV
ncbi:MAG TPA: NAD(P)/FAD-dependent oxidoreductase [Terracidiphilus sp.]|nr:NAD(P)/FAD-dependent oxidoreductase [Terracidiphilus sp.]